MRKTTDLKTEPKHSSKLRHYLFYGYFIVAVALLIIILDYGSRLTFGVFFKPMADEFNWSRALTSGAVTLSMLGQGTGAVMMGRLNDKLGPRFVMTLCGALLGAGYLLMAMVNNVWQLYLFYGIIVGLGMGGAFTAMLSTVARWFVKRRGLMTGITIAGTGIGEFIIPPLMTWLILIYGWHNSYIIMGGAVLALGIILAQFLKRDPSKIGLVPYGADQAVKLKAISDDRSLSLKEATRTRQFWFMVVTFFSLGYILMAVNIHLVPHITDLGVSATAAADIFAVCGGFTAIGCIVLGNTIDRLGSRRALMICFFLMTISLLWLTELTSILFLGLFAAVFGLASGGSTPIESTITADLFGMKSHGAILGSISFGFACGGAVGPLLTGYLFDLNGNYRLAFLALAIIAAIGLISCAIIRPVKSRRLEFDVLNRS